MTQGLPRCALLPEPQARMSWRDLEAAREVDEPTHYLACLRYARQLWETDGLPARALLALDRGLFCDVPGGHPFLADHPLPYAVVRWMVTQDVGGAFLGNPRVHYQHLADRVRGPREHRVRWRSWAAWAVVRRARPDLPCDPRHVVAEPTDEAIEAGLRSLGIAGEVATWRAALSASR
jgi:hypothetical protein